MECDPVAATGVMSQPVCLEFMTMYTANILLAEVAGNIRHRPIHCLYIAYALSIHCLYIPHIAGITITFFCG